MRTRLLTYVHGNCFWTLGCPRKDIECTQVKETCKDLKVTRRAGKGIRGNAASFENVHMEMDIDAIADFDGTYLPNFI